ncbi:MAG TPA: hypothetical protein VHW23_08775 [Kofleriaceae bacterium]|nr:hypothetical protein [Kofleriaceae bacterium]
MTRAWRRSLVLAPLLALGTAVGAAGCGGPQRAPDEAAGASAAPADPRTPIERRRDAACDALGPRLTACAVADTRADLAAGKIDQGQFDRDTAPEVQQKLTAAWLAECKGHPYSSRQVRVLEVCFRDETQCGPLIACLDHLRDPARGPAR